jgi:hypothetical protein
MRDQRIVSLWIMMRFLRSLMAGMRDQDLKSKRLPLIPIRSSQEVWSWAREDTVEADSLEACHRGTSSLKGEGVVMPKANQCHCDRKCHSLSETSMALGSLILRFMTLR